MRTWVEVDLGTVRRNAVAMTSRLQGAAMIAVVKADGYGHGAEAIVAGLVGIADAFAVAGPAEAEAILPHAGGAPVMCLYPLVGDDVRHAVSLGIGMTSSGNSDVTAAEAAAREIGTVARVHVKLDTGMHRHGMTEADAARAVAQCRDSSALELGAVWTHLACADDPADPFTDTQRRRLTAFADRVGVDHGSAHAANSGGALNVGSMGLGAARVGIALYGVYPSPLTRRSVELAPALSWRTLVTRVAPLAAGEGVSYGRTFVANRDMTIATLSVGYGDGYPYAAAGAAEALVRGRRVPVLGSVCMDSMVCDVSHVPGVARGDVVTLIGADGPEVINAADIARWAGTIPYEVLTRIARRVDRMYADDTRDE
ncbi:alanine racemase [Candidatus Poribacteria bacterium]|nr:alanine racemase [Candidatus Poribacteria bacterium]